MLRFLCENSNFFRSVALFSKRNFLKKRYFSPKYLRHDKRYRAEIFTTHTRRNLGWVLFFISKNIVPVSFGSFYKIRTIKKTSVFQGVFGIFAFLFEGQKIHRKKKSTHPKSFLVSAKKISARPSFKAVHTFYHLPIVLNYILQSSRGGLVVERWSDNKLDSITVDRIPLKYGVLKKLN